MKILHTADLHFGKTLMGRSMLDEQENFVRNTLLPAIDQNRPDAVIISGDIFDRQIPPVDAVRLFSATVSEICRGRRIPAAVIAGNHDGADRLAAYSELLRGEGLYISARPLDTPPLMINDGVSETQIFLLPYFEPSQARDLLKRDDIRGANMAYEAVTTEIKKQFKPGAAHVLAAHCFAAGISSDGAENAFVGGSESVDPKIFASFDYVALGHLHGVRNVGKNCRYSGSPIKYSFDEQKEKKSVTLANILPGNVSVSEIPCRPLHDMRTIQGTLKELTDMAGDGQSREDYIYAELSDDRPVFEPMARLRESYPNILGLRPGWLYNGNVDSGMPDVRRGDSDESIFEEFMEQICGVSATDDEKSAFSKIMKEVSDGR